MSKPVASSPSKLFVSNSSDNFQKNDAVSSALSASKPNGKFSKTLIPRPAPSQESSPSASALPKSQAASAVAKKVIPAQGPQLQSSDSADELRDKSPQWLARPQAERERIDANVKHFQDLEAAKADRIVWIVQKNMAKKFELVSDPVKHREFLLRNLKRRQEAESSSSSSNLVVPSRRTVLSQSSSSADATPANTAAAHNTAAASEQTTTAATSSSLSNAGSPTSIIGRFEVFD